VVKEVGFKEELLMMERERERESHARSGENVKNSDVFCLAEFQAGSFQCPSSLHHPNTPGELQISALNPDTKETVKNLTSRGRVERGERSATTHRFTVM